MKVFSNKITSTLLFFVLFLQGCAAVRPEADLSSISLADEVAFAKAVNPFVIQRLGAPVLEEETTKYLTAVGSTLKTGESGLLFTVVNEPVPAALALPGGVIVVTRGLFYAIESETELVVLLAHLIGHNQLRHGLQVAVSEQTGTGSADTLMQPSDYVAAAISSVLLTEPCNEDQEIDADRRAMNILKASGLDHSLIVTLLPEIDKRLASIPDFQSGRLTLHHQYSSGRLKAAEAFARTLNADGKEPRNVLPVLAEFDEVKTMLLATRPAFEMYQQARQLEKQGVVDRAITLYLQAASAAPEESFILTGLGMAYMRQEVLVAARQHLTRAARIDSNYYYSQLGLGYIYLQQREYAKAAKRLRRSQILLPTSQGGYLFARLFDEIGDKQSALKTYRDVALHFEGSQLGMLAEKRIVELESSHELE